jgi:hypothetical protein
MANSHQGINRRKADEQSTDKPRAQTSHRTDPDKSASREGTRDPKQRNVPSGSSAKRGFSMSDEFTAADTAPRGPTEKSVADRAAETIRSASHRVSDAIEAGREPDMPLHLGQAGSRSAAAVAGNRFFAGRPRHSAMVARRGPGLAEKCPCLLKPREAAN